METTANRSASGYPDLLAWHVSRLVRELRPDQPMPIADSLATEAIDGAAGAVLDAEWARQRAQTWPIAVASARARRYVPYAVRRSRQLADAQPLPGDHPGGPVAWDIRRPAREAA